MSQRRRRIVGVQAAAVALLVLLVYITLLRPEGPSDLQRIEAPGGSPRVDSKPEDWKPKDRDSKPGTGGGRDNPGGGGGAGGPVLAGAGASSGGGGSATTTLTDTTPSDDQYADSVTSLLRKVATGGSVGE